MQPRKSIQLLRAYVPGKSDDGNTSIVKLTSNENPLGPSVKAIEAVQAAATRIHKYPDDNAGQLRAALAANLEIPPENILFGAGSDEVLSMAIRCYLETGDTLFTGTATFPMYEIFATGCGAETTKIPMLDHAFDLDAFAAIPQDGGLVVFADPNNPTGTIADPEALDTLFRRRRDLIFVYDCAYEEYRTRPEGFRWRDFIAEHPNVFVTRTFSKAYALAGLRIGYGYGSQEVVDMVGRLRPPFNVSAMAFPAALAALQDTRHLEQTLELNQRMLAEMQHTFDTLGYATIPSHTNFMLVQVPALNKKPAGIAWAEALQQKNFLVRALPGIGYDSWIRINTGTEAQTKAFLLAVQAIHRSRP